MGENTKMGRTCGPFLCRNAESTPVSQTVTLYPQLRENMGNINYIKTTKGWIRLEGVDFDLWSSSHCSQDGMLRMICHSISPQSMADWEFSLICKWEPFQLFSWFMLHGCCPCCFYFISLSPAVFSPEPHFWIPPFWVLFRDWPVIPPLFSEFEIARGIWNKTGLVNLEADKITLQIPHRRSQRASEKNTAFKSEVTPGYTW